MQTRAPSSNCWIWTTNADCSSGSAPALRPMSSAPAFWATYVQHWRHATVTPSVGQNYDARKQLFAKGLKYGRLTASEIEAAVPEGTLTAAERWLLFYS